MIESIAIVFIVFATPVTILAMIFQYRLKRLQLERGKDLDASADTGTPSDVSLEQRAADLVRRVRNLEEILQDEGGEHVIG